MSYPAVPPAPQEPPFQTQANSGGQSAASQNPQAYLGHDHGDLVPAQPSTGEPVLPTQANKPSRKQLWIGLGAGFAAGILVSVLVAGTGSALNAVTESRALQKAVDDCGAANKEGVAVVDKGAGLTIDTKGEKDSSGASMEDSACILKSLEVPESVVAQMDATTAMQGRQTATWNNVEASWHITRIPGSR